MTRTVVSILTVLCAVAVVVVDLRRISNAREEVNSVIDALVMEALRIEAMLRDKKTVYVGDVLSDEEMFLFMTDGRISVIETPGTKFEVRGDQFVFKSPPPEPAEIEPIVIVRAWANDRFGVAIVHRGKEIYRSHSLYEAVRWFSQSGL